MKREQVFDREHIIRLVRAAHELLKDNKKKSPSALAFISDGRNEGGGRGHPGAKRGGRGSGRGRRNSGNGKAKSGDDDGKDAAEDSKKPAKGPMCYNCHVRGHFAADCKTNICKKCGGRGHDESKCPSPADMETALAVELPGFDEDSTTSSVCAAGFMAEEVDAVCGHPQAHVTSGKCDGSVPTCGVEGLAMQVGEAMEDKRLNKTTECRSDKKMGRTFVDENGEKPVASKGGKKYSIIFRDDATRMLWIYEGYETTKVREVRRIGGGADCVRGQQEEWMRCFLDDLRAFGVYADQWMTAAQDEKEWRRTAE